MHSDLFFQKKKIYHKFERFIIPIFKNIHFIAEIRNPSLNSQSYPFFLNTTTEKISKRFESIKNVEVDKLKLDNKEETKAEID